MRHFSVRLIFTIKKPFEGLLAIDVNWLSIWYFHIRGTGAQLDHHTLHDVVSGELTGTTHPSISVKCWLGEYFFDREEECFFGCNNCYCNYHGQCDPIIIPGSRKSHFWSAKFASIRKPQDNTHCQELTAWYIVLAVISLIIYDRWDLRYTEEQELHQFVMFANRLNALSIITSCPVVPLCSSLHETH